MTWTLSRHVDLANERIRPEDARRQMKTATEIVSRLNAQPGVILADEVGMGKTFVAMAVAASVVEATNRTKPVVVMVPPGVRDKWPRDWQFFKERCLDPGSKIRATETTITRGAEFLKLLDDPARRRKHIIFLSHGALTRSLGDPFVRLAIIRRAFLWQRDLDAQRHAFSRWARQLLRYTPFKDRDLVDRLLRRPPDRWRRVFQRVTGEDLGDEPVPQPLLDALGEVDLSDVQAVLRTLPLRQSAYLDDRLKELRKALKRALDEAWKEYLQTVRLRLPLLILDEAHHLKNPQTRLSSLLSNQEDLDLFRGPLGGVFRRMLFLTATPFQLGHHELIQVLRRFDGIRWPKASDRAEYHDALLELGQTLDTAQAGALRLDRAWGRLAPEDVPSQDSWWQDGADLSGSVRQVLDLVNDVDARIQAAEDRLRPWVIRHVREDKEHRRSVRPGLGIRSDREGEPAGLQIEGTSVLPFLLAARAQAVVAADARRRGEQKRAFFAEGLASSFEAYRETRRLRSSKDFLDDVEGDGTGGLSREARWYLGQIDEVLPEADHGIRAAHPKIEATVQRVKALWSAGEKVLVFCFYRHTGRALRNHTSRVLERALLHQAASKLRVDPKNADAVWTELDRFGKRFFDPEAPVTRVAEGEVQRILKSNGLNQPEQLSRGVDTVMRYLRTPVFLVRDVDLGASDRVAALEHAFTKKDRSGRSLTEKIAQFGEFAATRVGSELEELLDALDTLQTGTIRVLSGDALGPDEPDRALQLLPNVRLANGEVNRETRHRLMLAFNTPFYPEVLIASSVMAEGVDLHLDCRHTIHHDLDWNPSVLEQRTGRLDRLGSKAEVSGHPIVVYEPFVEGTQDEKQFRVVKDRERWFNVVMGEKMELDEWATDKAAERVPLPWDIAKRLTMRLEV